MNIFRLYPGRWRRLRFAIVLAFLAFLPVAKLVSAQAAASGSDANAAKLFTQQCGTCHSVAPGEMRVGPPLAAIVGKTAGKQAGFGYSDALKRSQMKWNAANLDRWLKDSNSAVPGSYMNYRQSDAAKRKAIIAYLSTRK